MTPHMSFHRLNPAVRNFGTTPKKTNKCPPINYHNESKIIQQNEMGNSVITTLKLSTPTILNDQSALERFSTPYTKNLRTRYTVYKNPKPKTKNQKPKEIQAWKPRSTHRVFTHRNRRRRRRSTLGCTRETKWGSKWVPLRPATHWPYGWYWDHQSKTC